MFWEKVARGVIHKVGQSTPSPHFRLQGFSFFFTFSSTSDSTLGLEVRF